MPPHSPPIFADVATRLRNARLLPNSDIVSASTLEAAAAAVPITTTLRLPSTRPLDHRWDRSRGIVFNNAQRPICTDGTWISGGNGIVFASTPYARRSYATRPIKTPGDPKPAVSKQASYVDNAHRTSGFTRSATKHIEGFKQKLAQLTDDVERKRQQDARLQPELEAKNAALADRITVLEQDLEQNQAAHVKRIERIKAAHVMEMNQAKAAHGKEMGRIRAAHVKEMVQIKAPYVKEMQQLQAAHVKELEQIEAARMAESDTLNRKIKEEQEARTLDLHTAQMKHEKELQDLRELAAEGLAKNMPMIEAVRREGEDRARKKFDDQVSVLKRQHASELQHEAREGATVRELQTEIESLERRMHNERVQKAGEMAAHSAATQAQISEERSQKRKMQEELETQRERNKKVLIEKAELERALMGRTTRAQENRADYHGYRELFLALNDQVYEGLAGANTLRDMLYKEGELWRKCISRFQGSKELIFFHQDSKYDTLKRRINDFLEQRKMEAGNAAKKVADLSAELYDARRPFNLQGHATRMVTRHLHFEKEPTEYRAVDVSQYMSLVLPLTVRKEECDVSLREVSTNIRNLKSQSIQVPVQLWDEQEMLQGRSKILREHLRHAEAFRTRESMEALLNSSVEDRITWVRMREVLDRIRTADRALAAAEKQPISSGRSLSALRAGVEKARDHAEEMETLVRKRVIVQQDLGQLSPALISEADRQIQMRIATHKREEELAMDVIVGKRRSSAKNYRERKAEQLKASSTAGRSTTTIEDVQASSGSEMNTTVGSKGLARPARRAGSRRVATPQSLLVKRHKLTLSKLKRSIKTAQGSRLDQHSDKAAISRLMVTARARLLKARIDEWTVSPRASGIASGSRGRDFSAAGYVAASNASAGIKFTPSQAMRGPHMPQLHDSIRPGVESSSRGMACPPIASHHASLKPECPDVPHRRDHVPMTTAAHQSTCADTLSQGDAPDTHTPNTSKSLNPPHQDVEDCKMDGPDASTPGDAAVSITVSTSSSCSSHVPTGSDRSEGLESPGSAEGTTWKPEPHTILDYQIPQKVYRDAVMASPKSNAAYWSHQLYKSLDGKTPVVYYCKNLEAAERQCKLFLREPVLGFDLEWEFSASPQKSPVKKAVSLIQIAAEDKICLIHVACFIGDKVEQLLPPSLKTILEDEKIVKAGVNVSNDANRMRDCFGVDMKGVFELSHMYRLVKTPGEVSFVMVNLATQVQNTLLLPLKKDDVRVSAWSKSLNAQQCAYAAADAYAGFRLFYQLDNLRKDLRPTPPRPAFFETMKPIVLGDGTFVHRSNCKPKSSVKKAIVTPKQDESDDEFFDAAEELPDTYVLTDPAAADSPASIVPKAVQDGQVDIDEADPDSVAALRDTMARTTLDDSPLAPHAQSRKASESTQSDASAPTQQAATPANKPPKAPPHVLVASPETILADMWISSLPSRNRKVGAASLKAYHLWHHQNHSLHAVAGLCRQPPLAMTSVASYIMTAIKEEDMPYDRARLQEAFVHLPKSVWHVYGKWVRELGLDR